MKKAKKVVALLLCAVLLVVGSVTGTMAYLTSQDEVVNTFTVGKVNITLDEKDTDNTKTGVVDGETPAGRDKANAYHVIPGAVFEKDPVVTVKANSENAYVRAMVTVTYKAAADTVIPADFFTSWVKGYEFNTWKYEDMTTSKETKDGVEWITRTYELRYKEVVEKSSTDNRLVAIFTGIEIPGEGLDNAQIATLEGLQIDVVAHAVQADGFTDAADAWRKTFDKPTTGNN